MGELAEQREHCILLLIVFVLPFGLSAPVGDSKGNEYVSTFVVELSLFCRLKFNYQSFSTVIFPVFLHSLIG